MTNVGWVITHPHTERPSSVGIPLYRPFRYLDPPALVMAVKSLDVIELLFRAMKNVLEKLQ